MTYYYHISYDEDKDEFWAVVDSDINNRLIAPAFTIDGTKEMLTFIKNGTMKHIDDTEGLEKWLKEMKKIKPDDELLICEEVLY